jgi:hypothetical protein
LNNQQLTIDIGIHLPPVLKRGWLENPLINGVDFVGWLFGPIDGGYS